MEQKLKSTEAAKPAVSETEKLKESFLAEQANKVDSVVDQGERTVKLVYYSACGCGGEDIELFRKVPFDSPIKDGDRTKEVKKGDWY